MKKSIRNMIIICIFAALPFVGFTACSDKKSESNDKVKVITTIYPQYDFTKQIAGDKADVRMLLKPGSESHSFEPTPKDMKDIENCDLFIYTGGENDQWVEKLVKGFDGRGPRILKLTDVVDTVDEEIVEGMEHHHHDHDIDHDDHDDHDHDIDHDDHDDHDHDIDHDDHDDHDHDMDHDDHDDHDDDHDVDEHVWTSPLNAIEICDEICDELEEIDPDNEAFYNKNCKEYTRQIRNIDKKIVEVVKNSNNKTILVGDRFPLRYFVDRYGLKYHAAFAGCSDQTEADASTLAYLIDRGKKEKLPVVFKIELSNGKMADTISEATGAEVRTFWSCHNITSKQFKNNESYVDMMEKNLESLKKALR